MQSVRVRQILHSAYEYEPRVNLLLTEKPLSLAACMKILAHWHFLILILVKYQKEPINTLFSNNHQPPQPSNLTNLSSAVMTQLITVRCCVNSLNRKSRPPRRKGQVANAIRQVHLRTPHIAHLNVSKFGTFVNNCEHSRVSTALSLLITVIYRTPVISRVGRIRISAGDLRIDRSAERECGIRIQVRAQATKPPGGPGQA